jgi:hypothetical protein
MEEMSAEMAPTMKLRWVTLDEDDKRAAATLVRGSWEGGPRYVDVVLQQWWDNGAGGGEWRDIEDAW